MLLRTHTSPVQVRTDAHAEAADTTSSTSRTYRIDSDATHRRSLHQVERLVIDKAGISATSNGNTRVLQGVLDDHINIGPPVVLPVHRAFAEVDIQCRRDGGETASAKAGLVEILGCGIVHPNVCAPAASFDVCQGLPGHGHRPHGDTEIRRRRFRQMFETTCAGPSLRLRALDVRRSGGSST